METLESSRVCRLCGQHSGICINIFDKNETHAKKINAVLPILVHEMDLLPKQMCHRCSYKLEEFHKFYTNCLKTDMDLKSQLSWMRKREVKEKIRVPMVQIENVRIKSEPPDYDIYELDPIVENVNYISSMSSMTFSMNSVKNNNEVNLPVIENVDKHFNNCDNRLADCAHCKCDYGKRTNAITHEAALSINCTNNRSKNDVKKDSDTTDLTNFQNNDSRKTEQKSSVEKYDLNASNKSEVNGVQGVKIKTEKPDDVRIRSLRPRKKSVDYIGRKKKKCDLIINPANINKSLEVKRKSNAAKRTADEITNRISVDKIKKEPVEEVDRRILRPRKFLINYLSSKRKQLSCIESDVENRFRNENIGSKKPRKSSNDFSSGEKFTNSISTTANFKVKEEIISDDETTNVERDDQLILNQSSNSCVRNLSNLFSGETSCNAKIKVEKNLEESLSDVDSSRNRKSESLRQTHTRKSKQQKEGSSKRISDTNCSQKYLRSHDLRLRNRKVMKTESDQRSLLKSLRNGFLNSSATKGLSRNFEKRIRENENFKNVPTTLKTANNIKHYCEKCCISFINKELYRLHVCEFE